MISMTHEGETDQMSNISAERKFLNKDIDLPGDPAIGVKK